MMLVITLGTPSRTFATVPSGFTDALVASVDSPTDITFTPGGRLVVTSKGGVLRVQNSNGSMSTMLDLTPKVCSNFERGLLGVTFDPQFGSNPYVYVFYTSCLSTGGGGPVNRVSRFAVSGNTADPSSEYVLVDNMPSVNANHNAGDLQFGKDGFLYISIGDGGCDILDPTKCAGSNTASTRTNYLSGKILRVDRNGLAPSSNPFASSGGECRVAGHTTTGLHCKETFAWGFRNPFRIALDSNSSSTKIFINDVGQNTWEEIDLLDPGDNYGWNVREGFCANGSTTSCRTTPNAVVGGMRDPVYAYGRSDGCRSITGGAFVPNGVWPSTYNGAYLYADYVCGRIFSLKGGSVTQFASNLGDVTALQFGPYGSGQALYYATLAGQVRRIANNNHAPNAVASADPTFGLPPLDVHFDGSASSDSDGDALTYRWNFDDGSPTSTAISPNHTYTTARTGGYDVTLTVTDSKGFSDSTSINIAVSNTPPQPVIETPSASLRFSVGEEITLHGSATDAQGQAITLHWDVRLRHDTHEHPFFSGNGNDLKFNAPAPEDLLAATNSYLLVSLTATDSTGLSATVRRNLMPDTVQLTFDSQPSGLILYVEGQPYRTPAVITSWAGNPLDLSAPDQFISTGEPVTWESWSVPGARDFRFVTPGDDATLTANYELVTGPAFAPVADARVRQSKPTTNEGKVTGLTTQGGTAYVESYLRFQVAGLSGNVVSATLYLYTYDGSVNGPKVYRTSNSWGETSINWNNRPASSGGALDDLGNVPKRAWIALDVTTAITGNGASSFLLRTTSTDAMSVYSREAASNQPRLVVVTDGSGSESTPPSVPAGLTADAPTSSTINLAWSASSDNVGVTGYDVFRNGVLLTSVGGTTFADTTVAPNTTYSYRVRARDAAGNVSALSSAVNESTPSTTTSRAYKPVADARVWEFSPNSNYGTSSELRAEGGSDPDFQSFLRFNIIGQAGTVYRATLRVFVPNRSGYGSADGPRLYQTGVTWSEPSITWNTRPTRSTTVIGDAGVIVEGTWVEYDVTAIIHGNGQYGFALVSDSTDVSVFSSREGANPPQLVITATGGSSITSADSPDVPAPSATPTATSTPNSAVPPFNDGFESGDLGAWSSVDGLDVTGSESHNGSFAAVAASEGAPGITGTPAIATKKLDELVPELYVKAETLITRQGSNPIDLITLTDEHGLPIATLRVDQNGDLALRIGRSTRIIGITDFSPGVWHDLQLRVLVAGDDSLVEVWLDGDLVASRPERLSAIRPIAAFSIGDGATDRTFTVVYDDVRADRTCIGTCSNVLVTPTPVTQEQPTEPAPTATSEPEPPTAPTLEPTATPTPEPTATATAEPTTAPKPTLQPEQPPQDETTPEP